MNSRPFGMPKIVYVNLNDINQHSDILGDDSKENKHLTKEQLDDKHKLCLKIFNGVAGHGM